MKKLICRKASIRSCIICRKKVPKEELSRLAVDKLNKRIIFDEGKRIQTRGCYCCPDDDCMKQLVAKKNLVLRALRLDVSFTFSKVN